MTGQLVVPGFFTTFMFIIAHMDANKTNFFD